MSRMLRVCLFGLAIALAIASAAQYTCPMDKDVVSQSPGKCPRCGMTLQQARADTTRTDAAAPRKIPDTPVFDQHGRKLSFYTDLIKGKTVAINVIFTTCRTICPPLTATFRKVQKDFGDRVGRDIHLISISVDPVTDTPERLKAFAAQFEAGPGWTFVTGAKADIDSLLDALGASVVDKNDHTPSVLIGKEQAGYWTRTYGLAAAGSIVQSILEAAGHNQAAIPAKAASPAASAAAYFPNLPVVTQTGKTLRFFDDLVKGRSVIVNFMFATCTGVCSPMTANLARVQNYLGDRLGKDIRMISITVDPEHDTPDVLAAYAAGYHALPGWDFLTGRKENVDWIAYRLGGYVEDKDDHTSLAVVGNSQTGEWVKVDARMNPRQLADVVLRIAR